MKSYIVVASSSSVICHEEIKLKIDKAAALAANQTIKIIAVRRAALSNYFSHLSENGEWDIYIRVNGSSVSYIPIYTDYYANLCGCFLLGIVNCQKAFLMKKIHSKSVLVTALSSVPTQA